MNEFIKTLLSLSVSGTLLLLLMCRLNPIYKNRFSKRWQYYTWLIAALRFLLPFTPDTTIVGSLFEKLNTTAITNESHALQNQANIIPAAVLNNSLNVYVCLFFIWSALALAFLVRKITVYQGYIQYIKAGNTEVSDIKILNLLSDCEEKLNIKAKVEIYHNALISSPIMIGFFRPNIILPVSELNNKELNYIFIHELIHYKQKDMFYKWFIQFVICIHWFNPFVHLLEKEVNKACELSCDEILISTLDDKARHEYGDTLISFLRANNQYKNSLASVTLTEGAEQLKERLGAIMNFKKKTKLIMILSFMTAVLLSIGGFAIGAYAAWPSPQEKTSQENATASTRHTAMQENGVFYISYNVEDESNSPTGGTTEGRIKFVLVQDRGTMANEEKGNVYNIQKHNP